LSAFNTKFTVALVAVAEPIVTSVEVDASNSPDAFTVDSAAPAAQPEVVPATYATAVVVRIVAVSTTAADDASKAFEPAGAEITRAPTSKVSAALSAANLKVTGILADTPTREAAGVPAETEVTVATSALAGATDVSKPKPREATATSATRLKVVFVDICFLSFSRDREFPDLGFG
jgi:hypothetical protein